VERATLKKIQETRNNQTFN